MPLIPFYNGWSFFIFNHYFSDVKLFNGSKDQSRVMEGLWETYKMYFQYLCSEPSNCPKEIINSLRHGVKLKRDQM